MERIHKINVLVGNKQVSVSIFKLDNDNLEDISRVYVVASNKDNQIPLIYNSKRDVWGFPGGHTEEDESIEKTAYREFAEEVGYELNNISPKFLLVNKIDGSKDENQVICFGTVGSVKTDLSDEDESVTKIRFTPVGEVLSVVGNEKLWKPILKELSIKSV